MKPLKESWRGVTLFKLTCGEVNFRELSRGFPLKELVLGPL
jgi:hypothetical protein